MRARRDERKAIMDAEKQRDREPGELEADVDDAAEGKDKPKKPWWKFWGD